MNIKRKCQVVMLPTNKKHFNKGEIILNPFINDLYIASMGCTCYDNEIPQHLYITSDEEIKEGDWCYNSKRKSIELGKYMIGTNEFIFCKKIIATTDISLQYAIDKSPYNMEIYGLPHLSQQFIEDYIKEYNKGNVITDVEVEYEKIINPIWESYFEFIDYCMKNGYNEQWYSKEKLKVNPDNTINIKSI